MLIHIYKSQTSCLIILLCGLTKIVALSKFFNFNSISSFYYRFHIVSATLCHCFSFLFVFGQYWRWKSGPPYVYSITWTTLLTLFHCYFLGVVSPFLFVSFCAQCLSWTVILPVPTSQEAEIQGLSQFLACCVNFYNTELRRQFWYLLSLTQCPRILFPFKLV